MQNEKRKTKNNNTLRFTFAQGFGIIELIIVTAIVSALLASFLQVGILSLRLLRVQKQNLEATLLAQQGIEAVRSMRDESWSANIAGLTDGISYYPIVENSKWKLTTTNPGLTNGTYQRSVIFGAVVRDGLDRIAASGTADPGTRHITSRVAWNGRQIDLITYLTDFQSSLSGVQETKIISYEGATTDTDLTNFPSQNLGGGDPVQTFTTLSSAPQVTRVDLLLRRPDNTPSDVYAEIRTSPTGTVLGTSHLIISSTISAGTSAWVEFRFQPPVSLQALTSYSLRLRSTPSSTDVGSESTGPLHWIYLQTPPSPYSGGVARRYVGALSNPLDTGQLLDQYDFGFKIYALQ